MKYVYEMKTDANDSVDHDQENMTMTTRKIGRRGGKREIEEINNR